jgi:hypothetical protein
MSGLPTLAILGAQVGYSRLGWRVSKDRRPQWFETAHTQPSVRKLRLLWRLLTMRPIKIKLSSAAGP